ncbi:CDGSH iron-sulfur domain-containing protein [Streptomyces sp. V4-01]|uniref:CDGSH iron-sulfur domain-containing protein n=1 Tax=Actinacidiphila polyblastidii TaxID=3110430 RepID=A0ABU7PCD8_9ACTN|nr:CDGSH iron-sulfur domain-containing protein [Streptomyces sp. V4-01]
MTVAGDDGVAHTSERFMVAVCTCRRSRSYPWCDTSHRRHGPARQNGATATGTATDNGTGSDDGTDNGDAS